MNSSQSHLNIVLSVCMQDDFIGPKGVTDRDVARLPLHGGARASARILGTTPDVTPIDDLMEVIHGDPNTYVLYIEDHHPDSNDPETTAHFNIFGRHCVEGTPGERPVGRLGEFQQLRRSQVISTSALNLVTHPPIVAALLSIIRECEIERPDQVRFLVLGGLTDVLVADAARGLNHIAGLPNPYREDADRWMFFTQVGVPSQFMFSDKPTDHDAAIRSMDKVAIAILKSNAEIFQFLRIQA